MSNGFVLFLLLAAGLLFSGNLLAKDVVLSDVGLKATAADLGAYLRSLQPGSAELEKIERDIAGLGADTYAERLEAFNTLRQRPYVPAARLVEATRDPDPEIRYWAVRLRSQTNERNRRVLMRVLSTISDREEPVRGLTAELLDLTAELPAIIFTHQAKQALLATAQSNDVDLIVADMKRRPAVHQLELLDHLLGADAAPHLKPHLVSPMDHEDITLKAARLLLARGQREPLAVLVTMLDEEGHLVSGAAGLLGQATGKHFADVDGWRGWLDEHGQTAELLQLDQGSNVIHRRLLVAIWDSSEVLEFDAAGEQRWKFEAKNATSVQGLPNGNRLLIGHNDNEVREFDAVGDKIWSVKVDDDPIFVQRLPDGNTHVACERSLLLFDPGGKKLREVNLEHRAWFCARRIANGNTLITFIDPKGVVEVDVDGKEVWSIKTEKRLRDASRLPNGNTLVVEMKGRVLEYSPDKKKVWESPEGLDPVHAVRLPSGNTRVVTGSGMIELTPTGQRIDILKLKLHKTPNGASYF